MRLGGDWQLAPDGSVFVPRCVSPHEREQIEAYIAGQFSLGWLLPVEHPGHVPALWFWIDEE